MLSRKGIIPQRCSAMRRERPDGILMVTDALTILNRQQVYDFATVHRLEPVLKGVLVDLTRDEREG